LHLISTAKGTFPFTRQNGDRLASGIGNIQNLEKRRDLQLLSKSLSVYMINCSRNRKDREGVPPAESNTIYATDKDMEQQGQRLDTDSSRKQQTFERVPCDREVEHCEQSDRPKRRKIQSEEKNTDIDKTPTSTAKKLANEEGELSYTASNLEPPSLNERNAAEELENASTRRDAATDSGTFTRNFFKENSVEKNGAKDNCSNKPKSPFTGSLHSQRTNKCEASKRKISDSSGRDDPDTSDNKKSNQIMLDSRSVKSTS